jgi:catalase (peroxidase I)
MSAATFRGSDKCEANGARIRLAPKDWEECPGQ